MKTATIPLLLALTTTGAALSGCAGAPPYQAPAGVSTERMANDYSDCRHLGSMQRDAEIRHAIELDCMGARGYTATAP